MIIEGAAAVADVGGGDMGGGDSSPAPDTSQNREPAQVIPRGSSADGDDGGGLDSDPANDNGQPRTRTPKPTKHKIKFFGQEREIASLEDVLPMLSDDYEHEIPVSGQARKAKYPDLVRGYQLSEGAFQRMQKAAETERQWSEKIKHGREDPEWALQMMFGIEDPIQWAAQRVKKRMESDADLDALYQNDRFEWQRRMDKIADDRKSQRDAFETAQKETQQRQQRHRAEQQRIAKDMRTAVEGAGMPWNRATASIAQQIHEKYASVGHPLPPADVAAMAREEFQKMMYEHMDKFDDDGFANFLGPERRKKLRAFELAQVRKGERKPAQQPASNGNGAKPQPAAKGLSEAEYLRQMRGGR